MKNRVVDGTVRLLDILFVCIAVPLAYQARELLPVHNRGPLVPLPDYWPFLVLTLLLWIAATWFFQVYVSFRTRSVWPEIGRIAKSLLAVALVHIATIFFLRLHEDVSRLYFGTYFVDHLPAPGLRTPGAPAASPTRCGAPARNTRVFAVVGSGDLAHEVVATVEDHPEWGLQFAGHILEDGSSEHRAAGARPGLGVAARPDPRRQRHRRGDLRRSARAAGLRGGRIPALPGAGGRRPRLPRPLRDQRRPRLARRDRRPAHALLLARSHRRGCAVLQARLRRGLERPGPDPLLAGPARRRGRRQARISRDRSSSGRPGSARTGVPSRCSSSGACTSTRRLAWSRCVPRTRPRARSSR